MAAKDRKIASLTIAFEDRTETDETGTHTFTDLVVRTEGFTAGHLGRDEALGCIASFLYGPEDALPVYLQDVLTAARWSRKYGKVMAADEIAALTAAGEPLEQPVREVVGFLAYEGQEPRK